MCEQAAIQDAEIQNLCRNIEAGQQQEIDQMKAILALVEMTPIPAVPFSKQLTPIRQREKIVLDSVVGYRV